MVIVQLRNVQYSDDKKEGWKAARLPDKLIYYKPLSFLDDPVGLKCECEQFRFMFEWYLNQKGALIGGPRHYQHKHMRPPVNPGHYIGVCKHVYSFVETLSSQGYIVG